MAPLGPWLQAAFGIIRREVPSRLGPALEQTLRDAPVDAQREFYRIIRELDDQLAAERRKARMFGRL